MKFNALTPKEDKKIIDALKLTAPERREETLECLSFEPHDSPQSFIVKEGSLYQSQKASILPRLKSLNVEPEVVTPAAATEEPKKLTQLLVTIRVASMRENCQGYL